MNLIAGKRTERATNQNLISNYTITITLSLSIYLSRWVSVNL